MKPINKESLDTALHLLDNRVRLAGSDPVKMVVCGGSSLIATGLVSRTTKDVDIVAFMGDGEELIDPEPIPDKLREAVRIVAKTLNLPDDWLNAGPADIFRMGLPVGFESRLIERNYGTHLTIFYISRLDQIHFKLYASVDRGGYHIEDLLTLAPTDTEILSAARWSMTHDVSEGYRMILKDLMTQLGFEHAVEEI